MVGLGGCEVGLRWCRVMRPLGPEERRIGLVG